MTKLSHSYALQHPERIHPALWRGSQLPPAYRKAVPTGYADLDAQLSGQGWPTGTLIDILTPRPGAGEIQLLKPALQALSGDRNIMLLNPPCTPSSLCLQQWLSASQSIVWIRPDNIRNTLWAAEKILQHNTSAALLCWFNTAATAQMHRLHLAARQSNILFFSLRPASLAAQRSVAPLRLQIEPTPQGLIIHFLKHPGPLSVPDISLDLYSPKTRRRFDFSLHHDALDQHPSALSVRHASHSERHGHRYAAIHT